MNKCSIWGRGWSISKSVKRTERPRQPPRETTAPIMVGRRFAGGRGLRPSIQISNPTIAQPITTVRSGVKSA